MRWWRALNSPRGTLWSRIVTALVLTAAGVLAAVAGNAAWAGMAFLLAFVNAAMAAGKWWEFRDARRETREGPHMSR